MGITLAIPFSQAPCRVFFLHSNFYLRAHKGAFMALFCYLSFLHGSRTPKFACFACTDYLHKQTAPTCYIGLQFRSVWLFNTLFKRSETHGQFLIFPASKIGFPQKGLLFSRLCGLVCLFCKFVFLSVYFFIYFFVYSLPLLLAFEYSTIVTPNFQTPKLLRKKFL